MNYLPRPFEFLPGWKIFSAARPEQPLRLGSFVLRFPLQRCKAGAEIIDRPKELIIREMSLIPLRNEALELSKELIQ